MQSNVESLIKLILVSLLVAAGLAAWLLPRTRFVTSRRIGDRAFVATHIIGAACGALGLALLLGVPERTLDWHLWELAVMPYVLANVYWIVVMRRARPAEATDEKQSSNIAAGAGLALAPLTFAMFAADRLQSNGLFLPSQCFPYFILALILSFSSSTLLVFRRG